MQVFITCLFSSRICEIYGHVAYSAYTSKVKPKLKTTEPDIQKQEKRDNKMLHIPYAALTTSMRVFRIASYRILEYLHVHVNKHSYMYYATSTQMRYS